MKTIIIEQGITRIGSYVFYGCTALISVAIPDSVTSIKKSAFSGCSALTSLTIPKSVTLIDEGVFASCTALVSLAFPTSVGTFGKSVFSGCKSLKNVTILNAQATTKKDTFEGWSGTLYCYEGSTVYQRAKKILKISLLTNNLQQAKVTAPAIDWTGKERTPKVTVTLKNGAVVPASNYSVSYAKNTNIGKAKIAVKSKSKSCKSSKAGSFQITPAKIAVADIDPTDNALEVIWKQANTQQGLTKLELRYSADRKKHGKLSGTSAPPPPRTS